MPKHDRDGEAIPTTKPCSRTQEKLDELHHKHFRQPLWETLFFPNVPGTTKHQPRDDLDDTIPRCLKCGCTIDEHRVAGTESGELPPMLSAPKVEGDDREQSKRREALIDKLTRFKVAPLECVKSAPDWKSAAELALFVASAHYHKVDVSNLKPEQVAKKLGSLRQSGENTFLLRQAAKDGWFNVEGFVPVHKKNVAEAIAEVSKKFESDVRIVLLNSSSFASIDRHVKVQGLMAENEVKAVVERNRLPILVGCSGSGKTATMIATGYALTNLAPLYWTPPFDGEALRAVQEVEQEVDQHRRDQVVNKILLECVKVTFDETVTVALVVDELGQYPNFLRALCSLYKKDRDGALVADPLQEVRDFLKCENIIVLAGGTGCDIAEASVGSASNSYTVIRMDDDRGSAFLDNLLAGKSVPRKLKAMLAEDSGSWLGQHVREALLNRRVAALFLEEATKDTWLNVDWYVVAPLFLHQATMKFKALNALNRLDFVGMTRTFAEALAVSLGGRNQKLVDTALARTYGLVVDKAVTVNDKVVLEKHFKHRYGVSPAVVRLFLMLLMGIAPHPRNGDGFEQTVADFVAVQLLAGATGVSIAAVDEASDPLELLKESVRRHARGSQLVATVALHVGVASAEDALQYASECLGRRLLLDNPTALKRISFAAVVRNRDKAPEADLFVVSGTLVLGEGDRKWSLLQEDRTDAAAGISVQVKHYTKSDLTEYDARAEFYKMGSREDGDCKGVIAANVSAADLNSGKDAFDAFQISQIGRAAFELPQQNQIKRAEVSRDLNAKLSSRTAAAASTDTANDLRLVALVDEKALPQWSDKRVAFLASDSASEALAPIALVHGNAAATGSMRPQDVSYAVLCPS